MVRLGSNVRWTGLLALVLLVLAPGAPLAGQELTGEQVRQAISSAIDWLKRAQRGDGQWEELHQPGGTTALAALALLNAGVPPNDPGLSRAIEAVRTTPNQMVYTVALKIQVLAAANPARYQQEIAAAADFLVSIQLPNGMWGYARGIGHGDFSNSQFALLGLHEADKAGARIPVNIWRKAERAWIQSQRPDGGWGYQPTSNSTGSMTTAGVASLYITGHTLTFRSRPGVGPDGRYICCGRYRESKPVLRGLAWLDTNFSIKENPFNSSWYFYYMYGLERVGILTGQRFIGEHDWYREGAAQLVHRQRPDGSWHEINPIVDTAFALLCLAKGHRPTLFNKLQWSQDGRWNLTRDDLNHLTSFIADRLGDPPTWEVVRLDEPLERWLAAPILLISGSDFPTINPQQSKQLREYIRQGGTLLAIAGCDGDQFRAGFRSWIRDAFPDYQLRKLPAEHPVFHSLFEVDSTPFELHGVDVGCRTSIFFSPHDLACLWEHPDIPKHSRPALELGANLAAYATGLEPLPDRLDVVRLAAPMPAEEQQPTPRGALVIAQLMHNGDWSPDPQAAPRLAKYLHTKMGVDIVSRIQPLKATDELLSRHPIVFMTGHFSFELSDEEVTALRAHLQRGGFLFAEACCGRKPFDSSFRALAGRLFPDTPLKTIPASHPIISGSPGVPLPKVSYRQAVAAEEPELNTVQLEAIELDGRAVIVYSRYGIGCGLDGHQCYACRGLASEDALKLGGNIVLYALSY